MPKIYYWTRTPETILEITKEPTFSEVLNKLVTYTFLTYFTAAFLVTGATSKTFQQSGLGKIYTEQAFRNCMHGYDRTRKVHTNGVTRARKFVHSIDFDNRSVSVWYSNTLWPSNRLCYVAVCEQQLKWNFLEPIRGSWSLY